MRIHGGSDHVFGWKHLSEACLWRTQACNGVAA